MCEYIYDSDAQLKQQIILNPLAFATLFVFLLLSLGFVPLVLRAAVCEAVQQCRAGCGAKELRDSHRVCGRRHHPVAAGGAVPSQAP